MKFRTLTGVTAVVLFAALGISMRLAAQEKQDDGRQSHVTYPDLTPIADVNQQKVNTSKSNPSPNDCVWDCLVVETLSVTDNAAGGPQKFSRWGTGASAKSCTREGEICNQKGDEHCCPE